TLLTQQATQLCDSKGHYATLLSLYFREPGAEIYAEIEAFPYARTAEGGGAYRESNRTDGHLYFSDMAHPPLLLPKAMNILTEVM
uniref:Uncharacterized protein n=1 Tax=Amphimedon queenslandica TaxID=400682 RepID=A0A1X7VJE1_AMPQE